MATRTEQALNRRVSVSKPGKISWAFCNMAYCRVAAHHLTYGAAHKAVVVRGLDNKLKEDTQGWVMWKDFSGKWATDRPSPPALLFNEEWRPVQSDRTDAGYYVVWQGLVHRLVAFVCLVFPSDVMPP